ncbi:MAG: hypothetical protein IJW55_01330 [Clostridia bacterium]|nr:hypothetical protein [Clostridia bacterium]
MAKCGTFSPAKAESYLLTTKLFCGRCGTAMAGESGTGKHGNVQNAAVPSARRDARERLLKRIGSSTS